MPTDHTKISISKLDAARGQLDMAIEMWFYDKDPVSVHTLAVAAHQIVHDINQKDGRGLDLLYDSALVKDEHRREWVNLVKAPSNFFKHADNDPDGIVEFPIEASLLFFLFTMRGLENLAVQHSPTVTALMNWIYFNRQEFLTDEFRKTFFQNISIEDADRVRSVQKKEFFEMALKFVPAK